MKYHYTVKEDSVVVDEQAGGTQRTPSNSITINFTIEIDPRKYESIKQKSSVSICDRLIKVFK